MGSNLTTPFKFLDKLKIFISQVKLILESNNLTLKEIQRIEYNIPKLRFFFNSQL